MASNRSAAKTKRKPLAECTNTVPGPPRSSFPSTKPLDLPLTSVINRILKDTADKSRSLAKPGIATGSTSRDRNDTAQVTNPSSVDTPADASTPSRSQNSSSTGGSAGRDFLEPRTLYTPRQTTHKRKAKLKAIAKLTGHSLAANINSIEAKREKDANASRRSKVFPKKKQPRIKREKGDASGRASLQDFIDRQRAYFAEIDAFKLPEEEVTSADELE